MTILLEANAVDPFNSVASTVSLSTSAAESAALPEGIYAVWSTADCQIAVGPSGLGVTAANGYLIKGSAAPVPVLVRKDHKIGGIVGSSTATLSIHKIQ